MEKRNGQMRKGDPRPGLEHVPPGWVLSPEVERLFGVAHGNQKRLFEALTKCGVHSIAIGQPGKMILGWAWNQTEVLEQEQKVRDVLNPPAVGSVRFTIGEADAARRLRNLEAGLANLTRWASKHEEWHRTALGEPGQAGPDENLQLSLDIGDGEDGEDGGDRPADRLGGSFGEAPGASKEGV